MTSHDSFPPAQASPPTPTPELSDETLTRCAELLATGEIDWPEGLSDQQEAPLVVEVRRCRRVRLVKFIAIQIAADIAREKEAKQPRRPHDQHDI